MRPTGKMHSANLEASPRLQRVLSYLRVKGAGGATTREIIQATGTCAVNSVISELRDAGILISCKPDGVTPEGGRVFRYSIETPKPTQGVLFQ
jgi:hypothetical protein